MSPTEAPSKQFFKKHLKNVVHLKLCDYRNRSLPDLSLISFLLHHTSPSGMASSKGDLYTLNVSSPINADRFCLLLIV